MLLRLEEGDKMGEKCNSGKIEREAMTLFYECVVTVVLLSSEYYLRDSKYSIINKREIHGSLLCSR